MADMDPEDVSKVVGVVMKLQSGLRILLYMVIGSACVMVFSVFIDILIVVGRILLDFLSRKREKVDDVERKMKIKSSKFGGKLKKKKRHHDAKKHKEAAKISIQKATRKMRQNESSFPASVSQTSTAAVVNKKKLKQNVSKLTKPTDGKKVGAAGKKRPKSYSDEYLPPRGMSCEVILPPEMRILPIPVPNIVQEREKRQAEVHTPYKLSHNPIVPRRLTTKESEEPAERTTKVLKTKHSKEETLMTSPSTITVSMTDNTIAGTPPTATDTKTAGTPVSENRTKLSA